MIQHQPNKITLHCSATPSGKKVAVDVIRSWHKQRGWHDIGYHFVIQPDGLIEEGRPSKYVGAHVHKANYKNLGICLIGNYKFTQQQFTSLDTLLGILHLQHDIPKWAVWGHKEFESAEVQGKTCPNMDMMRVRYWLATKDEGAISPYLL